MCLLCILGYRYTRKARAFLWVRSLSEMSVYKGYEQGGLNVLRASSI